MRSPFSIAALLACFLASCSGAPVDSASASATSAPADSTASVSSSPPPSASASSPSSAPTSGVTASPASPPAPACATAKGAKLELLAEQTKGPGVVVRFGLRNTGTEAVCVYTHVATHELQHDWLDLEIGEGPTLRSLSFNDARDKSAYATLTLAPGATDWQSFDVGAWALRPRNGGRALPKGNLHAHATYDTTREHEVWSGKLETSFTLRVP